MSSPAQLKPNQIEIGLDGIITVLGTNDSIVTVATEGVMSLNNKKAAEEIAKTFHGICIFTTLFGTNDPQFIFTVNIGQDAIKNLPWFLRVVRTKLIDIISLVDGGTKIA